MSDKNTIRIQKYFSDKGLASRRQTEEWIRSGYVYLNGQKVLEPGTRFDPKKDKVTLDPQAQKSQNYHYFLFHKPRGVVTVNAQRGEQEIKDIVRLPKGVVPVGRLDKESTGLIILTNDGVVARRIMEPDFEHEKEYEASFFKPVPEKILQKLSRGLFLFGKRTKAIRIKKLGAYRVRMILKEGKNRQIRRLCEQLGFPVKKLKRVRILDFKLDNLSPGRLKQFSKAEIKTLYQQLDLDINRNL